MKKSFIIYIIGFTLVFFSCKEEDPFGYEIEYQDNYPSVFSGNWSTVDLVWRNQTPSVVGEEYDLVTALDPNDKDVLIIDNIYNSNLRVRAFIDRANERFYVQKGEQLEKTNAAFDIKTISINGFYINDEDAGEVLVMLTGLYDEYGSLYDSIDIRAFRKTGFEDVEQYEFNDIFDSANE